MIANPEKSIIPFRLFRRSETIYDWNQHPPGYHPGSPSSRPWKYTLLPTVFIKTPYGYFPVVAVQCKRQMRKRYSLWTCGRIYAFSVDELSSLILARDDILLIMTQLIDALE